MGKGQELGRLRSDFKCLQLGEQGETEIRNVIVSRTVLGKSVIKVWKALSWVV